MSYQTGCFASIGDYGGGINTSLATSMISFGSLLTYTGVYPENLW